MKKPLFLLVFINFFISQAQSKNDLYDIINKISSERIENDIRKLANFGTRLLL